MKIIGIDGRPAGASLANVFKRALVQLNIDRKKVLSEPMSSLVKQHISAKYPGSSYMDPQKVKPVEGSQFEGLVDIEDIPSISRAYINIDIYPKKAHSLAIPLHRSVYGLSPRTVEGLFKVPNHNVLAKKNGSALVFLYALSQHVFQQRDPSIMPTDETFIEALEKSIAKSIDNSI